MRSNVNVYVNVIVVLNANVLRLDEDRRQRRSGTSNIEDFNLDLEVLRLTVAYRGEGYGG